jgi:low affinity Fe/Cu permease
MKSAKISSIGILGSIFLLTFALVIWLISVVFELSIGQDFGNIFEALANLSGGLFTLSLGILIAIFSTLILSFIFVFNNGYSLLITRIAKAQDKIDETIVSAGKKDKPKKQQPVRIRIQK